MITFDKIKSFSKHIKYCSPTIGSIFINNNFSMNNNNNNNNNNDNNDDNNNKYDYNSFFSEDNFNRFLSNHNLNADNGIFSLNNNKYNYWLFTLDNNNEEVYLKINNLNKITGEKIDYKKYVEIQVEKLLLLKDYDKILNTIKIYENKEKDIFSLGVDLFSITHNIDLYEINEKIKKDISKNKNEIIKETEKSIDLNILTGYLKQFEKEKGILNSFLYKLLCNIFFEESKIHNIDQVKNSMFYKYCSFILKNESKINNYNNEIINKPKIPKDITYDNFIKNLNLDNYSEEYSFCNESYDTFLKSQNKYVIDETIGMGGMSYQMIVRDKYDNKFFVKVIDEKHNNSFPLAQREIGAMLYLQRNQYENILNILNLMHDKNYFLIKNYYIITKYYNNGNLHHYLKYLKDNNIDKNDDFYLNIIKQLIDCIYTLHKEGFAHRDIKPTNILVDNDEKLILADFGSIIREHQSSLNYATQYYCSPELWNNEIYDIIKNDIFSMAVTICTIIFNITAEDVYKIAEDIYKKAKNFEKKRIEHKNASDKNGFDYFDYENDKIEYGNIMDKHYDNKNIYGEDSDEDDDNKKKCNENTYVDHEYEEKEAECKGWKETLKADNDKILETKDTLDNAKKEYEKTMDNLVEKLKGTKCNLKNNKITYALIDLLKHMLCDENNRYCYIENIRDKFDEITDNKFIKTNK